MHPWDLSKGSHIKINVTYNKEKFVTFKSLLQDHVKGIGKQNNIGFNKYGIEILDYTGKKLNIQNIT